VVALASASHASDRTAGRILYQGKGGCVSCHSIENRGGSLGPDLSDIGALRTREALRLALTDPDAEVRPEYITISVITSRGDRIEGIRLNEDDFSIQIRDDAGNPRSFLKDATKTISRELRSLMPSYSAKLSAREIDDLVAYLSSLKGEVVRTGEGTTTPRSIAPVSERLDWLTRPDRDSDERPTTVLEALQIPPGAVVADLGAGAGYFTWRLAERVGPRGKVVAVEIQKKMLDLIGEDLKKRSLKNVDLVLGDEKDPRLPPGAFDLVLVANAYHEFSNPGAMLSAIRRSLKPGGRLAVLEYRKEDAYTPLEEPHKMTLRELRSEIEARGFQTEQVLQFLPVQHLVIFTARDERSHEGAPVN
jgi:putative heme-binding domain-containing protein